MFLKNKKIIFKIRRSKVTDYAALVSSTIQVPKWVIQIQNVLLKNTQNSQQTQVLRYFKNISPIKLIPKFTFMYFAYNLVLPLKL